jgi:hypothetical protein
VTRLFRAVLRALGWELVGDILFHSTAAA